MPVPHFNIKITQRSKGNSAVAGAAYQAGEKLFSEYDQKTKNYTCKKEVVYPSNLKYVFFSQLFSYQLSSPVLLPHLRMRTWQDLKCRKNPERPPVFFYDAVSMFDNSNRLYLHHPVISFPKWVSQVQSEVLRAYSFLIRFLPQ